ncbi:MAG: hypothetical protein HC906_08525 [Bacteroidales bacterium]|nr:hypothetical protein [Bacteroidales bacterium]
MKIRAISIINPFTGPNTDGIDLEASKNVTISDCYISTGDDAICLKSSQDTVENVTVTNCILESDDAAIKFGTGSKYAIRFCTFNNIIIRKTRYGISLFMLMGGTFENNYFSNIIMEGGSRYIHEYPVFIDIDKRNEQYSYGKIRNITFTNIDMYSKGKILITGRPESNIEKLSLNNIRFILSDPADFKEADKPGAIKIFLNLIPVWIWHLTHR